MPRHASAATRTSNEHILHRLATTHRDSIGVIGRLSAPLSAPVAAMYADLFDEWDLPVPALFGQMVLPPAASTLLSRLAATPGHHVLVRSVAQLGRRRRRARRQTTLRR